MSSNSNVRQMAVSLLDNWLASELNSVSEDRENVLAAREKIRCGASTLEPDEMDAVIACVMEEIDVESQTSDEIVGLVQAMSYKK